MQTFARFQHRAREHDRQGDRSVLGEPIGELLAPVDVVHAPLRGDVRGHGALCLLLGSLFETHETLRAGHRALRRRLTLEGPVTRRFPPTKGTTDSQQSAFLRPVAELRGPGDALRRLAAALRSAKRARRTPECVPSDGQDILPDAACPLVTHDDAFLVAAEALLGPKRVRHDPADALVSNDVALLLAAEALLGPKRLRHDPVDALGAAEPVRRAAAGEFVSTERVLRVAGRTHVSLEDVLVASARVLVGGQRVRRVTTRVLVGPAGS
jgi:hypothetical protein